MTLTWKGKGSPRRKVKRNWLRGWGMRENENQRETLEKKIHLSKHMLFITTDFRVTSY